MAKARPARERAIVLDELGPPPTKPPPPGVDFYMTATIGNTTRTVFRRGKWLYRKEVTRIRAIRERYDSRKITREPARIKFRKILEVFKVEEDDDRRSMPWEEMDGWEHERIQYSAFVHRFRDTDLPESKISEHWRNFQGCVNSRIGVDLDLTDSNCRANYEAIYTHARRSGASKQVARELQACWRRRYIAQLVEWKQAGSYTWYYVAGEFKGESESVGGIDDLEYAEKYAVRELAEQLADTLEKRGYIVDYEDLESLKRLDFLAARRRHYKRNLDSQNWDDDI